MRIKGLFLAGVLLFSLGLFAQSSSSNSSNDQNSQNDQQIQSQKSQAMNEVGQVTQQYQQMKTDVDQLKNDTNQVKDPAVKKALEDNAKVWDEMLAQETSVGQAAQHARQMHHMRKQQKQGQSQTSPPGK